MYTQSYRVQLLTGLVGGQVVEEGEEGSVEGKGELIIRGDRRRERGYTVTDQTR